ncbi:uncharacterized protein KGF55_004765 [Candida pseudojiufengensis]|uniref:uncharacterized protein n=1 Tax=Candida pseudojiufengensis TaxID=497109 RepID=UPI002224DCAC|nr:uncharacterized protein KGF55_004765 [Candida pseudojiufengensis]KAI5960042.1 hypothetical protein KGF55_004765 [Candida pseudojiufengensis]
MFTSNLKEFFEEEELNPNSNKLNNKHQNNDLFLNYLNSSTITPTNKLKKDSKFTTSSISSISSSTSNSNSLIDFNKNDLLPELWQTSSNESYSSSDSLDYLTIKQDINIQHNQSQQIQQPQQPLSQTSFALENYLSQPQSPPTIKQLPNNDNFLHNHQHNQQFKQQQFSPINLQYSSPTTQTFQPFLQSPNNFNSTQSPLSPSQNLYSQHQELNSSLWNQPQLSLQQQQLQQVGWKQEQQTNYQLQSPDPFTNSTTLQQIYLLDEEIQSRKTSIIEYNQYDDNLQLQQQQQQQHFQQQQQQQDAKLKPVNTQLYKTELCQAYMRMGVCPYGLKCQFAHGEQELKYIERPPKWRSKPCSNWSKYGSCRYGNRCCFKHGD